MTTPNREYSYFQNGHEGTFDVIAIISPEDGIIARLYYWDEPDTDEGERVRESARIICEHLNRWGEPDYEKMYASIEPITEDSGHVIDSIFGVESVQRLRPDLTEQQAIMVLKAVNVRDNSVRVINREILKAAADELFGPKPRDEQEQSEESTIDALEELLAARRQIASVWGIEDVQCVRPDLNDEQAWMVLKAVGSQKDAAIGINWDILEMVASDLFGPEPDDE